MKLEIGENIYRLRKEKSLTQEQLSKLLLVSTAAVSKWESGISYPDITLLPQLATIEISFNEYDKAIELLEKISPRNLNKNLALSNAYLGKKDNEKARELLEESIILSYGELINSLTLLSNSFKGENLHLSLKIIDTLEKLRKIIVEKNNKEYNLQRIEIYESFEKTDDSIQCLKELKDYLKETENKDQLNTTPLWFITSKKIKILTLNFQCT